jgi:PAS domain S-box-containing protein
VARASQGSSEVFSENPNPIHCRPDDALGRSGSPYQHHSPDAEASTSRIRLADLIASVPGVVWELSGLPSDPGHRFTFVSQYGQQLLGYSTSQFLQTPGAWLGLIHPDDRRRALDDVDCALRKGSASSQVRWHTRAGDILWVESRMTIICDMHDKPAGLRGVTMDITDRKLTEDSLRQRADELTRLAAALKRSNDELDQFAYITSHDLKAPLRGIANLSKWIEEDSVEKLGPQAQRHLEMLRGRVNRMEALINGLLQYSRVGREKVSTQAVDTRALLADILELLDPPPAFTITLPADLPTIRTSRLRLQQVNLLSNAIKHHHRTDGRIDIACRDVGQFYEFSVSDDGPGIDPRFHERIFVIFQTLAPRDRVEAAGVGLSLVKKIVEEQGGTTRIDSSPGKGATFTFTWPKTPPEAFEHP